MILSYEGQKHKHVDVENATSSFEGVQDFELWMSNFFSL